MMQTNLQTSDILDIEARHTSGAYPKRDLALVRGEGSRVWDADGNAYLDATSGQGVAILGHSHPAIVQAITSQAQTLITCPEIFYNDQRAIWYETVQSILPTGMDRFFLCNSGTEAMEGALKLARLLTNRTGIIATKRAFHGRTLGALALTWNPDYRKPFADWQASVTHITYNDLEVASSTIDETICAVVVEAIQGEGGVHPAEIAYLQHLRQLCDERGALLIVDEIQTGLGRTGRWFAFEHADITPDIITLGKGIAGGVPMGAVVWQGHLGTFARGAHGSTFGGNPLALAASSATLSTLQHINAPQRAEALGNAFIQRLQAHDLRKVRAIRGQGLMIGVELRERVTPILMALQAQGILALPAGKTVLRLLPPLIITEDELDTILTHLVELLA